MSLSTSEIEMVVRDLAPRLEGGKIVRIDQPDRWRLILHIQRQKRRYWLQLVAHPRFSRLHLLTRRPGQGKPAGGMCNTVRQHLTGAPVLALRQVGGDRVVTLESSERDALLRPCGVQLVAELVGPGSNLILVDESNMILGSLFTENSLRRRIAPGEIYMPLPQSGGSSKRAEQNRFTEAARHPGEDELALSRAIQNTYEEMETRARLEDQRLALLSPLRDALRKLESRRQKLEGDLQRAERAEEVRRAGELLKIACPSARKGQDHVVVRDLFEPTAPEVRIALDPALTPEQNIERLFRRYKKLKAGRAHVVRRLDETSRQLAQLERLAAEIEAAEDPASLQALRDRVRAAGLRSQRERPRVAAAARGPRRFVSADGMEILVARNAGESHTLTFSIARGDDYWMHLRGWAGPHVVIRKPRDRDVPLETLLDAAHLAVHYSKIRGTDFAEVVYTQRKHVRAVKGAGPGRVNYSGGATLAVRLDQDRLRRLTESYDGAHVET